jgi:hypothetical protein
MIVSSSKPTASARGLDGEPFDRDEYADSLEWRLDRPISDHSVSLTESEAIVASRLLDELAGVYAGERIGELARKLAVMIAEKAWM